MSMHFMSAAMPQYGNLVFNYDGTFIMGIASIYRTGSSRIVYQAAQHLFKDNLNADIADSTINVWNMNVPFRAVNLTNAQIVTLTPSLGWIIYDTDLNQLVCWDGSAWRNLF